MIIIFLLFFTYLCVFCFAQRWAPWYDFRQLRQIVPTNYVVSWSICPLIITVDFAKFHGWKGAQSKNWPDNLNDLLEIRTQQA